MRNKKQILIEQLDNKLQSFQASARVVVPDRGWVNAIRTTLNMTMAQLGKKLGISRQGVNKLEKSEVQGALSLNSLKEVARALDLKLVYGFVPKDGSLNALIDKKARQLAEKIVWRTHQNMVMEAQGIEGQKIEESIKDLALELKREMRRSLWD